MVFVLIVGRSVGAITPLFDDVLAELRDEVLDVSSEVVVKVGSAVSMLVSEGALALVSERFASLFDEVAAAALLFVVDIAGDWECGRPVRYRGLMQA